MKRRHLLLVLGGIIAFMAGVFLLARPKAKDFCTNSRRCKLSRVEFEGQGRHLVLDDPVALRYLSVLPRLEALPPNVTMSGGLSFDTKLFDRWGRFATVQVAVSDDKKVLSLAYFESPLSDTSFSFILLDSNAPSKLLQSLDYLAGENR